jgi:hypothetical protein
MTASTCHHREQEPDAYAHLTSVGGVVPSDHGPDMVQKAADRRPARVSGSGLCSCAFDLRPCG